MPPEGQLLNPESLPLLLESTYIQAGALVPPPNTSGTTPDADMFYGALAGITFQPHPQNPSLEQMDRLECKRIQIILQLPQGSLPYHPKRPHRERERERDLERELELARVPGSVISCMYTSCSVPHLAPLHCPSFWRLVMDVQCIGRAG